MSEFLNNFFNWPLIWNTFPDLLTYGILNTLLLAALSSLFGAALGILLALAAISRLKILRWPARAYIDIFRGLPAALTILAIGEGIFAAQISWLSAAYPAAVIALSLMAAAYMGEVFRSGIQSVEHGQTEACRALGLSHIQALWLVVIPQGLRRVLPALVNQFIGIIKDSSLVYFLGLSATQRELFRIGDDAAVSTGNLSPLVAAGICYLIITVPLTHLVNYVDDRLRVGRKVRVSAAPSSLDPSDPVDLADVRP
jgi:polar amino acid transport system permease protein